MHRLESEYVAVELEIYSTFCVGIDVADAVDYFNVACDNCGGLCT